MIPGQFDYVRPADIDEALRILKDREGEAKLLSGGYSLIPLIKLRLAQPALLVDMRDITGLDYPDLLGRPAGEIEDEARRRGLLLSAAHDRSLSRQRGYQTWSGS